MPDISFGNILTMVVMVFSGLGLWFKYSINQTRDRQQDAIDKKAINQRLDKHELTIEKMLKEQSDQRLEDLKREMEAERARNSQIQSLQDSVRSDMSILKGSMDEVIKSMMQAITK